jgi:hypothetical protein
MLLFYNGWLDFLLSLAAVKVVAIAAMVIQREQRHRKPQRPI